MTVRGGVHCNLVQDRATKHPVEAALARELRRRIRSQGGGALQSVAGLGHGTPGVNSARPWGSAACSHGTSGANSARPSS
ncbi:hypothetical protein quinque_015097 [Culex quinquefasciatus]